LIYSYVIYVFIGIHELAEKLGFGYLFIKKKVKVLRRPAEASQRSGKTRHFLIGSKYARFNTLFPTN